MSSRHLQRGRFSIPGGVYSVTTVTKDRRPVLTCPLAAAIVIDAIRDVERARVTSSFAWVVMPDHVHWLFQLRSADLAYCMQRFKSRSSRILRRETGLEARLWQPSYYDHALRAEEDLRRQALYIVANPVRAGLACGLGAYPFAWCRWSLKT